MSALKPDQDSTHDLGSSALRWANLFVDDITLTSTLAVSGTTESSSSTTGALTVAGGLGVAKDLHVGDDLSLSNNGAVLTIGSDETFVITHSNSNGTALVSSGDRLAFGDNAEFISGDGTNLTVSSSGNILLSALEAGAEIDLTAASIDINGAADVSGNLVVGGNLTVNGTTTTVDTQNLQVKDANILINDGGSTAGSAGAGLDIEGDGEAVVGFMKVAGDTANLSFKAPTGSTLTLDVNADKTLTVAGDLTVELGAGGGTTSVINQDLSSDSTAAAFATLTLSTSLLPDSSGGADIGSASAEFGDIFIGDAKSLKLGEGQDVTISHDNGTGLDIDSAGAISIESTSGSIALGAALADGQTLKLGKNGAVETIIAPHGTPGSELYSVVNTSGTAENAIALTSSAGGVDIDAAAAKNVDISGGQVLVTSKDDSASAIALTANVGSSETIVVTNTQGTDNGAITLTSTAGGITAKVADGKDLTLGNAGGDAFFKVAASSNAANEDVRIVNTNGTDEAAIALTSTAGGVDIDAAAAKDVNIAGGQVALVSKDDAASAISLTANIGTSETIVITNTQGTTDGSDDAGAIELSAAAGGIGLAWADDKDLWAEGGRAIITANEDAADAIKLHADAGTSQTIAVLNDAGTAEGAISLTSTAGGVDINAAADKDVTIDAGQVLLTSSHNVANAIYLRANAGTTETIKVHADQGTSESSVQLLSDAGGVDIDAAAAKDVSIAGGQVSLASKDDAASAIALTANVGSSETIVVTNTQGTAEGAITLTSTAGGVDINAAATKDVTIDAGQVLLTASQNGGNSIKLHADAGAAQQIVLLNDEGTTENAIALTSTAGGVDIDAAAAKDVNIAGGQVTLVSKDDAASAISLTTNQGTSETIVVTNTQGNSAEAISLSSQAGGITLSASSNAVTIDSPDVNISSGTSQKPVLTIKNTTNDANGASIKLVKDKGAAGADGDDIGNIEFVGDDAGQVQTSFAKILAEVSEADNTDEAGKLSLMVAASDGTNTALVAGLVLEGEHATGGEVDVTLGAGGSSLTTVAGSLTVTGDFTVNGTNTVVNSTTLQIDDKNIELAHSPSGSEGDDASVDGGGITLKSSGSDKTITYVNANTAWELSENLVLASGKSYSIDNGAGAPVSVLNATTLGSAVLASSLTSVGALASGSIAAGFGAIDNGTSNITTGGVLKIDVDGTAINAAGSFTLGAGNDAGLYFKSNNELFIENTVAAGEIRLKIGSEELLRLDGNNDRISIPQGVLHIAKDNSDNILEIDTGEDLKVQFKEPTRFDSAVVLNEATKTIDVNGSIAVTSGYHKLECAGSDTTDNLDSLSSGSGIDFQSGQILILQIASGGDTITVRDNQGSSPKIMLSSANFAMNSVNDTLSLIFNGTDWCETSRSDANT